jgi:hypothetical protein
MLHRMRPILNYILYLYENMYWWYYPPISISNVYIDHNLPNVTRITSKFIQPTWLISDTEAIPTRDSSRELYEKLGMTILFDNTLFPRSCEILHYQEIIRGISEMFSSDPYIRNCFDTILSDSITGILSEQHVVYLLVYELQNNELLLFHTFLEYIDQDHINIQYYFGRVAALVT